MLQLANLTLERNGETWIHPAQIELERGSLTVLLGATGAGKTSLMRLMAGLDRPSSGRVEMDGRDVTGVSVRQRNVAMVYQQFINYPRQTVRENIASPLRLQGLQSGEIEQRVGEAAGILKLNGLLDRLPAQLSGGQQQRVALARALAKRAELVLLDEPLANLDYKLREELRRELPGYFADSGSILVYATSDPAEALMLGGTTVVMHEGRILQTGAASEVYRRPASLLAAQVCSDPPLNLVPADGALDASVQAIRAHHLKLGAPSQGELGFDGRVEGCEITGSETFVHVEVRGRPWILLMSGAHSLARGEPVRLSVAPQHVLSFSADGSAIGSGSARAA